MRPLSIRNLKYIVGGAIMMALAMVLNSSASEDFSSFIKGGWCDHISQNEFYGFIYKENQVTRDPFQSLKDQGWNYSGVTLFTCTNFNPLGNAAVNDIGVCINQARRAKAAGLKVALNLLYRDDYPSVIPVGWPTSYTELQSKVYDYTMSVMNTLATNGVTPDLVKVENEVDHNGGILLPVGKYDTANFYGLLKAGCQAVKDFDPAIPTLIHSAGGNNYMLQKCIDAGIPFDVYAISYYPVWGGTIAALPSHLSSWATLGKRIMLIETAKQWTAHESDSYANLISNEPDYTNNPVAAYSWYHDLEQKLAANPLGAGVFIWPTTLTSTTARTTRWDNTALWDSDTENFQPIVAAGIGGMNPPVSLYSCAAGKYVSVDVNGNLVANATFVGTNEQFNLTAQSQGYVSLVSKRTGKYVTANTTQVTANASSVGDAQKWRPDSHTAGYDTGNVAIAMFSKSLSTHLDATVENNWQIGCGQNNLSGTAQQFWIRPVTAPLPPAVWTNLAGGLWWSVENWTNLVVGAGADVSADFNQIDLVSNTTVHLNQSLTIGNLMFGDKSGSSTWTLDNNGNSANALTLASSNNAVIITANTDVSISAQLAGTNALKKSGPGILNLAVGNTYTGGTMISNGTINITADSALGTVPGSVTPGNLILDGGALSASPVSGITLNVNRGTVLGPGGGTLIKATTGRLTYTGIIAGTGALTFLALLSGSEYAPGAANTYSAGTTLLGNSGATVILNGSSSGSPGSLTQGPFGTGPVVFTGPGIRSGTGGNRTIGNEISLAADIMFPTIDGENSLTLSGPITLLGGGRVLTVNIGSTDSTKFLMISGSIGDGGNGYGLTKAGAGVLKLSGANSYSGNTLVSAGTLALVSPAGPTSLITNSPRITVRSGATLDVSGVTSGFCLLGGQVLSGDGIIAGSVSVTSNAVVAPGPSLAQLTFTGSPILQGDLLMKINRTNTLSTGDQLAVDGQPLVLGGRLTVTNMGPTLQVGDSFTLLSASAISGSFTEMKLPALPNGLNWNTASLTTSGVISVVNAPVDPPAFFSPTLAGNSLILTGTNGLAGGQYRILSTTNVALPRSNWRVLATNFFIADGSFAWTNTINLSNAGEFFSLQLP